MDYLPRRNTRIRDRNLFVMEIPDNPLWRRAYLIRRDRNAWYAIMVSHTNTLHQ